MEDPNTNHLAMTFHGIKSGLDEIESALSLFAGILDSLQSGNIPTDLNQITIIDRDLGRVERLRSIFEKQLSGALYASKLNKSWGYLLTFPNKKIFPLSTPHSFNNKEIETAGKEFTEKPSVFVDYAI